MLQKIDFKILGQPSSSSCCEEIRAYIPLLTSLRMPQCAKDLVFIHNNLRLLSRRTPEYSKGETKSWDIAGNAFDSLEDLGMLEVANFSLDDPKLEAEIIKDDGVDKDEDV